MGTQFVDGSPGLGSIFSNLAGAFESAPGKALDNIAKAEAIKAAREKRARDDEMWELGKVEAAKLDAATPQAQAAPITAYGPMVGDINNPADTAGIPTATFVDPRQQAAAEAKRAYLVGTGTAAVRGDLKYAPAALGYASVGATGVPDSAKDRAELEYMTTGKFPSHIGRDESKNPIKNWNEINPETQQPTGRQIAAATAPGPNYVLGSPRGLTPDNKIESVPIAQNNFNELANKIRSDLDKGIQPKPEDLQLAMQLKNAGWPAEIKLEKDGVTGKIMPVTVPKVVPPDAGNTGWLYNILGNAQPAGAGTAAAVTPPAPAATGAGGDPAAAAAAPAAAAAAAAPAAATAAAVPPPLVTTAGPLIGTGDPTPVVQRYMHNPVVVAIENAKTGYSSFIGNVNNNDPAADLALVIGAAKVLDPPSVVREGEVENVKKTGGIMDKYIGMINQAATGESGLTKEVRAQLWNMVNEKLKIDTANAQAIREPHKVQLMERGVRDPDNYLPKLPQIIPVDWNKISNYTVRNQRPETEPVPDTRPSPPRARPADDLL